jgi:hypothetical protein
VRTSTSNRRQTEEEEGTPALRWLTGLGPRCLAHATAHRSGAALVVCPAPPRRAAGSWKMASTTSRGSFIGAAGERGPGERDRRRALVLDVAGARRPAPRPPRCCPIWRRGGTIQRRRARFRRRPRPIAAAAARMRREGVAMGRHGCGWEEEGSRQEEKTQGAFMSFRLRVIFGI